MTRSLVCGVDHSPHARRVAAFAAGLADRLGLRIVVVHAVPVAVPQLTPAWPVRMPPGSVDLRASEHEAGDRLLEAVLAEPAMSGATARLEEGPAPECLVRIAEEEGAEYIVVGTEAESAAHCLLFGSTSLELGPLAPCPVVVVPPSVTSPQLVWTGAEAVVCGMADPEDVAPLHVAIRLARTLGLPILTALVVPIQDERASARDLVGIRSLVDSAGASRAALDGPAILVGDPADELAEFAARSRAAMLVVGTRGRGPVRSALLGSVARSLGQRSATPFVVCPAATRSPSEVPQRDVGGRDDHRDDRDGHSDP